MALALMVLSSAALWAQNPAAVEQPQVSESFDFSQSVDTAEQLAALREHLLYRFADAAPAELEQLRAELGELAAEVAVDAHLPDQQELPGLPVSVARALQVVEQRRKLTAEIEILRQTVRSLPEAPEVSAPETLAGALLAVDALTRQHELARLRGNLNTAEAELAKLDGFLQEAALALNPSVEEVASWTATADQPRLPLDFGNWSALTAVAQLSSAAASLNTWLARAQAELALRVAGDRPAPEQTAPDAKTLSAAIAALEQAYTRADRRLNLIDDDHDRRTRQAIEKELPALRKQLRRIDQDAAAFNWLVNAEKQRWEAVTPFWQRRLSNLHQLWESVREGVSYTLNYALFEVGEATITPASALRVMAILFAAWFASRWIRRGLERYGQSRPDMSRPALYAAGRVVHYTLIALGFGISLAAIGLDLTKIAIFASALGVGIGFGLQTVVNNFISGLILLFERSLKMGDFVELESGVTGEITDISIRATRVTTNDNIDILVPNSEFVNGRVTSWTLREISRRIRIGFGVAYGVDKELVKKAALEAADSVPFSFASEGPRRSQVWLVGFGDNSLDFELVVWLTADAVKRPGAVQAAYYWALEDALEKYGIEIPFPQRDLHVRTLFGLKDESARELWSGRSRRRVQAESSEEMLSEREREVLSANDALDDALAETPPEKPEN